MGGQPTLAQSYIPSSNMFDTFTMLHPYLTQNLLAVSQAPSHLTDLSSGPEIKKKIAELWGKSGWPRTKQTG